MAIFQSHLLYPPPHLIHVSRRSGASDEDACPGNCSFFFFFLADSSSVPCPVSQKRSIKAQARGKVHPNAISSALCLSHSYPVSMLPCSCSPSRPCYRLCVPEYDTAKTPEPHPPQTMAHTPAVSLAYLQRRGITLLKIPTGGSDSSFPIGPGTVRSCQKKCGFYLKMPVSLEKDSCPSAQLTLYPRPNWVPRSWEDSSQNQIH